MAHEIRMPSLGQTTDELRILAWLKAEGDHVDLGEPLLEVETDKATLAVESYATGTLLKIMHGGGETVRAGTTLAYVGAQGEPVPHNENGSAAPAQAPDPSRLHDAPRDAKVLATPVARHLARQHGIEISHVRGSGPAGLIEKADVLALVQETDHTTAESWRDLPVPEHRRVIAQRLTQSIQNIPQITLTVAVDASAARQRLANARNAGLAGLTYTHLLLRSVAQALRAHPHLNRLWLAHGPLYRQLACADVGLAVAGEDTLLVLTIPEPDRLPLADLVTLTAEAVQRGRAGALTQRDTAPTAITISNLGMHAVDGFQAIVDPAQAAILAVGRVAEQVVAIDGAIRVLPQLQLSLSVDHRVADGVAAARFLGTIKGSLEQQD